MCLKDVMCSCPDDAGKGGFKGGGNGAMTLLKTLKTLFDPSLAMDNFNIMFMALQEKNRLLWIDRPSPSRHLPPFKTPVGWARGCQSTITCFACWYLLHLNTVWEFLVSRCKLRIYRLQAIISVVTR